MEDDAQVSGQFEGLDIDEIMTLKRTYAFLSLFTMKWLLTRDID